MKKEKLEKISFISFSVASICFYISAFFSFISKSTDKSTGVINLCLGSTLLCLASVYKNKKNNK